MSFHQYNLRSKSVKSHLIENIEENSLTDLIDKVLDISFTEIDNSYKMALNIDQALKIIPEFSGKEDLDNFLAACELVNESLDDANKEKLLRLIKIKLTGKACIAIKYKTIEKYEDLKRELKSQFKQIFSAEQLQTSLCLMHQKSFEDVQTFANRVEEVLFKLNDVCVAEQGVENQKVIVALNSKTALKAFVDGLRDPIKIIIKACRFKTLSEAISQAIEEEVSLKSRHSMSRSVTSISQNNTQPDKSNTNFQIKCQICNKIGHTSKFCFFRHDKKPENKSVAQVSLQCNYCKHFGHVIKDCRKRQFNEAKKHNPNNQNRDSDRSFKQNPKNNDVKVIDSKNDSGLVAINSEDTLRVQDL